MMILPIALDWLNTYAPAALAVWHGKSPYTVPIYFAAPWATLPLIPFALMPYEIGRIGIFILGLCTFAYIAYRMGAKPIIMAAFLLSYPVLADLYNGNIEWMPMLGFILPPQIGLIFVLIKPQIGIGITIYWFIEGWRTGGVKQIFKTFAPVTMVFLLSCALYGFWPLHFSATLELADKTELFQGFDYNFSLWPYGSVIGLLLLYGAFTKRDVRGAIASSPFLSPYTLIATYGASIIALSNRPVYFFLAWLATWVPVLVKILVR
jgi:hypothetical protein